MWTLKPCGRYVTWGRIESHLVACFAAGLWQFSSLLAVSRPERYTAAHDRPARVKQADIARALREAQKIGAKRVKIGTDGSIDIVLEAEEQTTSPSNGRHDPTSGGPPKRKVPLL